MFWFFYVFVVFCFSYLLSLASKKNSLITFSLSVVILLTPAQIEVGSPDYAPALFSFLFDVFLKQDYSLRALRPLVLSIPISFFILLLFFFFKKRFL
tara:strand:- start:1310 stop:1600 length:291 start_codon:yes stop_codon:yes gene_type:complete